MKKMLGLIVLVGATAQAAPVDLSYSGRLLDASGVPVNGAHAVEVALFDGGGASLGTRPFAGLNVEDGYFSVVLSALDSAWFTGPVSVEVRVDGALLGARQALVSVPHAAAATVASSVPVAASGAIGACTLEGAITWDALNRALKVCDGGGSWVSVSPPLVVNAGAFRRWSDGSFAASCEGYRHPSGGRLYQGDVGDGVYRIDPDGAGVIVASDAYCDMTTDGGGWTLLFNLASRDAVIHDWRDTAFWTAGGTEGAAATALATGHKSAAFADLSVFSEVMVNVHNAEAASFGHAIYSVLSGSAGLSLQGALAAGNDRTWTSTATSRTGTVGAFRNPNRVQTQVGDLFVDHAEALVLNKTSGWAAAQNLTRIATTLSNADYAHTYAGLGGEHQNGIGGWGLLYESAPISPYCSLTNGYGAEASYLTGNYRDHPNASVDVNGSSNPFRPNCRGPNEGTSFTWIPADTALYVR